MHIGCRNDSTYFMRRHIKFFQEQVFPYILENGITHVIQLGDIFDRRKFVNFSILQEWKRDVLSFFDSHNVNLHIPVGNHDCFYRNTNEVNSPKLLLSEYRNIHVYDKPQHVEINGYTLTMLPWINSENFSKSMEVIEDEVSPYIFGHLEISGFEMHKGQVMHEGISSDTFKNYSKVFSGHFHTRSNRGNIYYVGTPYEMTWIDHDDPKGFHILDLKTGELEFIKNNDSPFIKIQYDDKNEQTTNIKHLDLNDKIIKLVVVNKTDFYKYDQYLNEINAFEYHDFKIVDTITDIDDIDFEDEELQTADTQSLITEYIDDYDVEDSIKSKLQSLFKSLYVEAINKNQE